MRNTSITFTELLTVVKTLTLAGVDFTVRFNGHKCKSASIVFNSKDAINAMKVLPSFFDLNLDVHKRPFATAFLILDNEDNVN